MKILILSTFDQQGGAAKAAFRLHCSLLKSNIDSNMLVQLKENQNSKVVTPTKRYSRQLAKLKALFNFVPLWFYKSKIHFSTSFTPSYDIIKKIQMMQPDIVHLHWIGAGMLKIEDLMKIKSPIVWSLHDNWAFTGGCHVVWQCENYRNNCGKCPNLKSQNENDLSRKQWNRKQKVYEKLNQMTIVGLSTWISNMAKESALFKNKKVITLPNPIDTNFFRPQDSSEGRLKWNLPMHKKIIVFGANWADSDINKGYNKLFNSINMLEMDVEIAIFGMDKPSNSLKFKFKTHYLGFIKEESELRLLYNSANVTLVPSLQENLSNVIMESMSCGTPVVGFNVGGNSDMIEHKVNGYLAQPYQIEDFSKGIEWVLKNENDLELRKSSRKKIKSEFDSNSISLKYKNLYEEILNA